MTEVPSESQDAPSESLSSVISPDPKVDQKWARQQWTSAELGDKRRTRRAVLMGERMALNPGGSIPEQMGSWASCRYKD
ncbi:MAG: transposase DNA-binding-containing protein [Thermodesulfobacteriota bacterium]